jgi:hypothetical protein
MVESEFNTNPQEEPVSELPDPDQAEKARRRWRTENKMSSVNKRRNVKDRKAEAGRSNTKRGRAWKGEDW